MSLKRTAISGLKWTTIGTLGNALFQLLQVSILARYLPREAFGIVAMALFVVNFSNIFVDMGISTAILHRQNATKKEYSSIYWLNLLVSLFLYLCLLLCTPLISAFFKEPRLLNIIPLLSLNLVLIAIGRQHRTIMQKKFRFKFITITELIAYLIGLITATLMAMNDFGVYSLVYSTLIASLISNLIFLILNLRQNPIEFYFKLSDTKSFLKIGGYSVGSALLDFISREVDTLIIGKFLGAEKLGIYTLAKQIVLKLYSFINPVIFSVFSPLLSTLQDQKEKLNKSFLEIVKNLAYINFPIYLILVFAAKEVLYILYGANYVDASPILVFLAFAYCMMSMSNPVGSLQIATGRTDLGFKWTIIRVFITPPVIFLGVQFGLKEVSAFFALLTLILLYPVWFVQIKPMTGITFLSYMKQFYKPLIFFSIIVLLIYLFEDNIMFANNYVLSACLKSGIILLLFGLYMFIFDGKFVKRKLASIGNNLLISKPNSLK
jgi:O-antigen/teichoic acid export membrane protein